MTGAEGTFVNTGNFLEILKALPWCKQRTNVLVAVHKATPEIIEIMQDHELRVFPGNLLVKMQKSTLNNMQQQFDEGQPLPVVVVWKEEGVEIWYRKHKASDFPYDAWNSDVAKAYEQERVFVPAEKMGARHKQLHAEHCAKSKECPAMIPAY